MFGDAPFTLQAPSGTDIWKKPPSYSKFDAPISHTTTGPLSKFRSARVTFRAAWTELYDQAGVLLVPRKSSSPPTSARDPPPKWIKTGVEYYRDAPHLSTVACERFADWSVAALWGQGEGKDPAAREEKIRRREPTTIEVVREQDEMGRSIWIYHVDGAERTPLREVCWLLADAEDGDDWMLEVSPLVARPAEGVGSLEVEFGEFDVKFDS